MSEAKITIRGEDLATATCDRVRKAVEDLTPSTNSADAAFKSMKTTLGEAFENPTALVQRLGGALASDLAGGLGSAGIAAGIAGGAVIALGTAAFGLAEHAAAIGGNLNDMSEKTGVSVEALSRLQNASALAGSDLASMTNALFVLQKGLGENSTEVSAGLKKIGLTTEELKAAGPDQYMALIAQHMKATADPAAKAAAVMEIFGKSGKELIPTLNKLDDALERTGDIAPWTTTQAAAAEQFEMQMASIKEHVSAVGVEIGRNLIPAVSYAVDGFVQFYTAVGHVIDLGGAVSGTYHLVQGALGETALAAETAGAKQDVINKALSLGAPAGISFGDAVKYVNEMFKDLHPAQETAAVTADAWIKKLSETAAAGIKAAAADADLTEGLARMGIVRGGGIEQVNEETQALEKATEKKKKAEEQEKKLSDEVRKLQGGLFLIPDSLSKIGRAYDESKLGTTAGEVGKIEQNAQLLNFGYKGMAEALEHVGEATRQAIDEADKWEFVGPQLAQITEKARSLSSVMTDMPHLIMQAMTGGGGIAGAAKAIGSDFGSNLGENITDRLTKHLTDNSKKALSPLMDSLLSAIPGIGSLIGPLAGKVIEGLKNVFGLGVSAAELAGRRIEASFEQSFGGFDGMMAAVGRTYEATGRGAAAAQTDVKALLDAEKNGGAGVQAMIDKINGAFSDEQKKAGDVSKAVDGILAAAKTVGGDFPDAMKPLVDQLRALPGLTDAERDSLLGLTGAVKPNFADLTKTAKDYGLSLADLGPSFEQADISGRADRILSDFGALSKAGADSDHVLHGMGKSINTLINDALKYGSTLPTALQPLAEQLAKTGQLTDTAGNKLDDLSGLKFNDAGDPLAKGMSSLTDALNRLGDILSPTSSMGLAAKAAATAAAIGESLAGIPDRHVAVIFDRQGDGGDVGYAASGGFVTRRGISYFNDGGFVPRGTDTIPAMLTPGEAVLNRGAVDRIGRSQIADLNRGGHGDAGGREIVKALREDNATLHAILKRQGQDLNRFLQTLPIMMRHAARR